MTVSGGAGPNNSSETAEHRCPACGSLRWVSISQSMHTRCTDCGLAMDACPHEYAVVHVAPAVAIPAGPQRAEQLDHLTELLAAAEPEGWTVAFDHDSADGDDTYYDEVWVRGPDGETIAMLGERYTMAPKYAALIVALASTAPALLATVRRQQAALDAVTELAGVWAERGTHVDTDRASCATCYFDVLQALKHALPDSARTEATT